MFAYCGNNPVIRVDSTGDVWCNILSALDTIYTVNNWVHTNYNKKLRITGYIYNQNTGVASQYWFGLFRSSHNGCGWIATYNALIMLGNPQEPYKIISYYEKWGALVYGAAGILPTAVAGYFRSRGYTVKVSYNTSKFDTQAKSNTANVLFYWHDNGAHNIAVRWNGWEFIGYNVYSGDSGPKYLGASLAAFLKTNGYTGAMLTSIS